MKAASTVLSTLDTKIGLSPFQLTPSLDFPADVIYGLLQKISTLTVSAEFSC